MIAQILRFGYTVAEVSCPTIFFNKTAREYSLVKMKLINSCFSTTTTDRRKGHMLHPDAVTAV